MKKPHELLFLAAILFSCGDSGKTGQIENTQRDTSEATVAVRDTGTVKNVKKKEGTDALIGLYTGEFVATDYDPKKYPMYSNKISLFLDSVKNNRVKGHSVVAGGITGFSGSITALTNFSRTAYAVEASEPGKGKYDGVFSFTIIPEDNYATKIRGKWKAFNKKLPVSERSYDLYMTWFEYSPEKKLENVSGSSIYDDAQDEGMTTVEVLTADVEKFNPSIQLLSSKDVENMYKRDLEVMRNSIYARHGYSFQNRKMRYFFDHNVYWYVPVSIDVTRDLTEIEKKNIELIKRYEKHAEAYYDSYGR